MAVQWWYWTVFTLATWSAGYMMKQRGIRNLDHRRNQLFRCPECVAPGRLIQFPRWSKSRIPCLFHCIRYLYYTSLSVCLSATAKYCSRVLEVYRSRQDRRYLHPAIIFGTVRCLNDNTCDHFVALLLSCNSLALIFVLLEAHKLCDAYREV